MSSTSMKAFTSLPASSETHNTYREGIQSYRSNMEEANMQAQRFSHQTRFYHHSNYNQQYPRI